MKCLICRVSGHGHHILTRKAHGRIDLDWNLMPLCLRHHSEVHQVGMIKFAKTYPIVKAWLLTQGWVLQDFPKRKWSHD